MEQGPSWEANNHWAIQEIPLLLWNQKIHISPPLDRILSQMLPVRTSLCYFPKIHSNTILLSISRSSEFSSKQLSRKEIISNSQLSHACYVPGILLRMLTLIFSKSYIKLFIMLSSPASCHFSPLGSKYSPQHPALRLHYVFFRWCDIKFHIHTKKDKSILFKF